VSFEPFLSDIQRKLENQYELSYVSTVKSGSKPGLQGLRVKTSQPNTSLLFPTRVPVGGTTAPQ
jgi:hypothetical protein